MLSQHPSVLVWQLKGGAYVERARVSGVDRVDVTRPFLVRFSPTDLID